MSDFPAIHAAFSTNGWFQGPGAYVLVDGQFGSTGKGALAALVAALFGQRIDVVTTNAGPNSGHTGYLPLKPGVIGEPISPGNITWDGKVVTQQIPVAAVVTRALYPMHRQLAYLNGGAVIDPKIVAKEALDHGFNPRNLLIHPCAAVIDDVAKNVEGDERGTVAKIASTGKGVGAAQAHKIMRDPAAVAGGFNLASPNPLVVDGAHSSEALVCSSIKAYDWNWSSDVVFVETAQGFSLGINSAEFYPYTTSRECTVMQAIADARIPAQMVKKGVMAVRTFPIRVGNTDAGQSGGCYPDQQETTWEALGVEPELTTVTKRVRRVFTWSREQFQQAVDANRPDAIFVTFLDYLKVDERPRQFLDQLFGDYVDVMDRAPDFVLGATGPRPEDVRVVWEG